MSILTTAARDRFHFEIRTAVRPEDIGDALLQLRPRIVHFSGHGTVDGKLVLHSKSGRSKRVGLAELASLFKLVSHQVECVVLNFAFSQKIAEAIAGEIEYVIGFKKGSTDKLAIAFSAQFYGGLASGCTIIEAFNLACTKIRSSKKYGSYPELIMKP